MSGQSVSAVLGIAAGPIYCAIQFLIVLKWDGSAPIGKVIDGRGMCQCCILVFLKQSHLFNARKHGHISHAGSILSISAQNRIVVAETRRKGGCQHEASAPVATGATMPRKSPLSKIDVIRKELTWVSLPFDPDRCGCRHFRCSKESGNAPGECYHQRL